MNFKPCKYHFILIPFIAFVVVASPLRGQEKVSEQEINTQKIFIDASKEKLLGNYEQAITLFKEVLKRDSSNDAALYEIARIYEAQNDLEKALHSIRTALSKDSGNEWYAMFLADIYDKMGKPKEAARIYENLVERDDNNFYYYEKWAFYLVKAGDAKKAVKVYDTLESKVGINQELSDKKYRLYLGLGDQKNAAKELEMLIQSDPLNTDYRHMLANFYIQTGDEQNAEKVFKEILEINPDDGFATIALAEKFKTEGDDPGYLSTLKPIFENPEISIDVKIQELIPYIQSIANMADEPLGTALADLAGILEQVHPKEAKSYAAYGDILYYTGDHITALQKYQKALELDKTVFPVWEQVMDINLELRNFNDLLRVSENALEYFPNQASAYYFHGVANGHLAEHREALNSLQQALMMSRRNPALRLDIYHQMAIEHHHLKEFDKSDAAFDEALKINPQAHSILNRYSYYLALRGERFAQARQMCERVNELNPDNPYYQDTYAWVLYKMKDFNAAKEWLEKALSNGGDQMPDILEHYGDILFQLDDVDKAISFWQKAQEKGSTSKLLSKKIADRRLYE